MRLRGDEHVSALAPVVSDDDTESGELVEGVAEAGEVPLEGSEPIKNGDGPPADVSPESA